MAFSALTVTATPKENTSQGNPQEMDKFITELMGKMTLHEKIGQLNLPVTGNIVTGQAKSSDVAGKIRNGEVGGLFNLKGVKNIREVQKLAVENSRLGIPLLFGMDVIHGYETVFPIPLALSCSWDMEAIEKSARIAAIESSADGICWTFSPMVDISRDPRWGRVSEGSGEDPFLGGAIARAMVNNPRILLADEPTGALDARTSRVVMDNFRTLCHKGGVAMIMVTHDPKMAEFCDSVYTLEDGILVCKKHDPVPVSPDQQQNLLAAPTPILRGALVAEKFPEASGRCLMEEAHRMHAAGLLSRIYAIEGASFLNSDSQGYALPLPVRHISSWRFFSVMRMLFSHLRGTSATAWELWKSIPSGKGSFFHNLWLMGCGALLARWCLEERIEFLYASGAHAPASAAWVAARMLQIPFAFAVRTADLASPAKDWLVKAEQAAFVRCDTEATRKAVCELLPSVDPRRIVLLRDALTLTPPDEDVSMPPSNVPEPLQLLAVGTMTSRKGYDTLLQACLALQKAGVDFRLTLVGTGPWRLRLRLLSWRLGLRKLVSFPGQLPHEAMTDLYRRTDIFIAPGHMTRGGDMDGLPSALTEAMAFGVAVVVSDLPGQLEVVQNGRSGIVVPQNDVTALSQALLDLAGSAEKRRHLGAEAWKRIREVLEC